ncbi:putative PetM of cytochrome b6/f complex subunit 7 [Lupinus albus]|uniref:Putative PetM of cytochrome b6/f complex subunit 7 n=1 Tax=Lupinus albus TaxID=3870 RepID=A0A6A4PPS6_LUPAL|nr:putative PetM of cytochrome b6/f complex subunit 7 [Lupinus albus]
MAMATIVFSPQNITGAIMRSSRKTNKRMVHVRGLNSFGGLKANNGVISMGLPLSTEKCFSKIVSSMKITSSNGKGKGGGALSSTCNAAGEIFTIAAIINGLVLVGVAIGFVLLRIEAFVEEQEVE